MSLFLEEFDGREMRVGVECVFFVGFLGAFNDLRFKRESSCYGSLLFSLKAHHSEHGLLSNTAPEGTPPHSNIS